METARGSTDFLIRPRLIHRVQEALAEGAVWIIAPPGYGKTTLLRALEEHLPGSRYIALRPSAIDPACLQETLDAARDARVLLLDDLHWLADGPEAIEELAGRIAQEPRVWVVSGRWVPGPLSRRPLPQTWLTEVDLAFSVEEIALMLSVDFEQARRLHARTRGWPMAIALLAQPDAGRPLPERWPQVQEQLFTTLAHSLLHTLPEDIRRFLFCTAIPLSFNIELAAALLEDQPALQGRIPHLFDEVRRRRLFLEPAGPTGWWRYHEIFREFLLRYAPEIPAPRFARAVRWFEERGDLEAAIEHALTGQLEAEALRLLRALPDDWIRRYGRQRTFRRWVLSLGEPARRSAPDLMLRMGGEIHRAGQWAEGRAILHQVLREAEAAGDRNLHHRAIAMLASMFYTEGRFRESLAWSLQGLQDPAPPELRIRFLKAAADACTGLARLGEARRFYREAVAIAETLGDPHYPIFLRHNLAVGVEIPSGRFAAARTLLLHNRPYYEERPAQRIVHLLGWAILFVEMGDWRSLEGVLSEIESLSQTIEAGQASNPFWFWWCRAMGAIGQGRWEQAAHALAQAEDLTADHPEREGALAQARAWEARRRGRPEEAIELLELALPRLENAPLAQALLALEWDLANWALGAPRWHPATHRLIAARAGAALVRLRALLALCAHQAGDPRWVRHANAVLRALRQPGFERLLIDRDPELGHAFWRLCLVEGIGVETAIHALGALRPLESLADLLRHPDPQIRARAARALAATRGEEAIPLLRRAVTRERHPRVRRGLVEALRSLEDLPPPPLEIRLMGTFEVQRGGVPIPESAWPRPAVARLLQYFALHRRQWLPRERILEDLWPERDPEESKGIFRRLFSWLRQILEPYMSPRGPFRYFATVGEALCFDPADTVRVDVEVFEETVRRWLAERPLHPEALKAFARCLAKWSPLLPGTPYEPWLIPHQERLRALYTEAAYGLAEAYLAVKQPAEAIPWAERVVAEAPWMEEAYQVLMRAWARIGRRAQALKVYEQAVEALRRELQIPPSSLTDWLMERLRRGDPI